MMVNLNDHSLIVYTILVIPIIISIIIGILLHFLNNRMKATDLVISKMLDYHSTFYDIDTGIDMKVDRIIDRQNKLATILQTIRSENREHDKKVKFILDQLGVRFTEDNGTQNPGA